VSEALVEPLARPRILLSGDVAARPDGLERALTRAGFQLTESSAGEQEPPDAVLLTLSGAGEAELAALDLHPPESPPLLVLFAAAASEAPAAALARGADDAMAAPISFPELYARLHARIRDRQAPRRTLRETRIRQSLEALVAQSQASLRPEEVVLALVRRLARAFDLARCSLVVTTPGPDQGQIVAEASGTHGAEDRIDLTRYPEIGEAIRTCRPVAMPEVDAPAGNRNPTTMVLPVPSPNGVTGVLLLRTREAQPWLSSVQLEFAGSLAQAAARALDTTVARDRNGRRISSTLVTIGGTAAALTLERRLAEEYERARRYSLSFSLVLFGVNGSNGAAQSAEPVVELDLVQDVESRLRRELRLPDFVSRYGAGEIAAVLPETGSEGARRSVYRVRQRLSAGAAPDKPSSRLAAGIVTYPHPSVTQADDLLALVETALVRGRAQVEERIGVAE
jgi:PleD family two-component response regulator